MNPAELPVNHPVRNLPMNTLTEAQCRNLKSKTWRDCRKWKIGSFTYNQLGKMWTDLNEFRLNQ